MQDDKDFYFDQVFKDYEKREGFTIVPHKRNLGKGSFGLVKLIMYKNKNKNKKCAGKIVTKDNFDEIEYIKELVGPHIIKSEKICQPINKYGKDYYLIIMERAQLQDLSKLNSFFHEKNLLKLIYPNCFDEKCSDTVLKFFARQIIDGMMTLYQYNYVHFDIKPENILVLNNLILKITDFDLLKKIDDNTNEFKIPGGTQGYMTCEYHLDKRLNANEVRSQDYFALGCTLFSLKYGFPLLKYQKEGDGEMQAEEVFKILERRINYIKSHTFDKDFITFITNLLKYKPNERPKFEEIYRSKWLDSNSNDMNVINKIVEDYDQNDEKLLLDLQKQDYFNQKKQIFEINDKQNTLNKKNKRYMRKCFKFKKRKEDIEIQISYNENVDEKTKDKI